MQVFIIRSLTAVYEEHKANLAKISRGIYQLLDYNKKFW